jgi:transposase
MQVKQEELGDLPLLGHIIKQTELISLMDQHFPVHGNWKAPSIGKMVMGWLMYIISECDHRLYTVEGWAESHLNVLRQVLEAPDLQASAFQDDRLGMLLEFFAKDERWAAFQKDYNASLLRLYALDQSIVRVDSFNAPSYREARSEGLFQFGYQKSHQADEPYIKTMVAALDPMALPVATYCVSGSKNDDDLYVPAIEQARQSLLPKGLLYVGDVKMGSAATCANLASSGNFYLCPLSNSYYPKDLLEQGVAQALSAQSNLLSVWRSTKKNGPLEENARVFELPERQRTEQGTSFVWTERLVLVLSLAYAASQERSLKENLREAQQVLLERFLPRKHREVWKGNKMAAAKAFVDKVLHKYRVQNYLDVDLFVSPNEPDTSPISITIRPNETRINKYLRMAGWRIYVTNADAQRLPPVQMVEYYRQEYRIEQQFHKLLTKTTDLLPINLKNENRVVALIRVVILALQFVTLIQHTIRSKLKEQDQSIKDLIPGNRGRAVNSPTAELILKRFKGINAIWIQLPDQQFWSTIQNLDPVHNQILILLNCPHDLYHATMGTFNNVNELA